MELILKMIQDGIIKHDLKILPEYYQDVVSGKKKFELRKYDRNYQVGDIFVLREFKDGEYTGECFINSIEYILKDCHQCGLQDGFCIFGW